MHEAKTHLSRLISEVESGEEVTIARNGRPVAKLSPYTECAMPRRPGTGKGQFRVNDDFDAPLPDDVSRAFRDSSIEPAD